MNRDEKAAVIDEVAIQIKESEAIFALDYRGLSVPQAADLRDKLSEADATLRVIKNRLTALAADKAGAEGLKDHLGGPTAFTFVRGDAALAAKVLAAFRKEHDLLEFKGGTLEGNAVSVDQIEAIAKLPAREVLHGQLVGVLASPVTGLVRGLNALIQGLALQLGQIAEQGLVGGASPAPATEEAPAAEEAAAPAAGEAPAAEEAPAEGASSEEPASDAEAPAEETSGDKPAENDDSDAPSEGEAKEG